MHAHARDAYPHECCGAMFGTTSDGVRVVSTLPLPNTTEEGPRRRFLVQPRDYQVAEREADARSLELLGFYHSHPDHPAVASAHDLAHAWPSFHYVIVSVVSGRVAETRNWKLDEDRARFSEIPMT